MSTTTDPYTVPAGTDLSRPQVAEALAACGIDQRSYTANGALHHHYRDRLRPHRWMAVVESTMSKHLTEVTGDATLWLLVRETARTVCAAPALAVSEQWQAATVEQAHYGLVAG